MCVNGYTNLKRRFGFPLGSLVKRVEKAAHPASAYLDLWMARILSLKYSWFRKS